MPASICPILDETKSVVGLWAAECSFTPALGALAGLMSLAKPVLQLLTKEPYRRVFNDFTDVGNEVILDCGVFLMLYHRAERRH